jgi:hypothetical protein
LYQAKGKGKAIDARLNGVCRTLWKASLSRKLPFISYLRKIRRRNAISFV